MPKYEVTRSYTVASVATVEAPDADQAACLAMSLDCERWKEYDGDYDADISVTLARGD
tara:strand:+ start:1193 stop:1366 length:174 start_codon:yes stop_codon:yes gene_type:complete